MLHCSDILVIKDVSSVREVLSVWKTCMLCSTIMTDFQEPPVLETRRLVQTRRGKAGIGESKAVKITRKLFELLDIV